MTTLETKVRSMECFRDFYQAKREDYVDMDALRAVCRSKPFKDLVRHKFKGRPILNWKDASYEVLKTLIKE